MLQTAFRITGVLVVIFLITAPVAYASRRKADTRNFRVVREGVLYRSGQMTHAGLARITREYGIRTIISLRDETAPGKPAPDLDEEKFCAKEEINFLRLPPQHWEGPTPGAPAPVDENVSKFREVLADPANYPVLIHCFAGVHRSGAYCAIYRMEQEHWTNQRAMQEMRDVGYVTIDEDRDIFEYLEHYRPAWQEARP
jgi:tyrosine-protein phosphatase SIW14